jgi:serine protease inhibitor
VPGKQTGDSGQLSAGYDELGLKLLARLSAAAGGKNVFISPAGIAFTLGVVLNGAGGVTKRAVASALGDAGAKLENFNRQNLGLRARLVKPTSGTHLAMASALWSGEGISFRPTFLKTVKRFYDAEARSLDFDTPAAPTTINAWARKKTAGKISSLVGPGELDPQTECVLTNAVYFKGQWASQFDKGAVRRDDFHLQDGRKKVVMMMSRLGSCRYFEDGAAQLVCLPYAGGGASACFILPPPGMRLQDFLSELDRRALEGLIGRLQERAVGLLLPRFELTYDVDLRKTLVKLGLAVIFTPEADFSPMGLPGRYIMKFKHKTAAEVNEEGTEAAAATAVMMGRSLFSPPQVIFNRPFFWAIRHEASGALLFAGAVFDPS